MEAPVHCVVHPYDPNIAHHSLGKVQLLPGSAEVVRAVYHSHPFLVVQGDLDDVGIGPAGK